MSFYIFELYFKVSRGSSLFVVSLSGNFCDGMLAFSLGDDFLAFCLNLLKVLVLVFELIRKFRMIN